MKIKDGMNNVKNEVIRCKKRLICLGLIGFGFCLGVNYEHERTEDMFDHIERVNRSKNDSKTFIRKEDSED